MIETTKCSKECGYWSEFTGTCDYSYHMRRARGCPQDACTKFVPRTEMRSPALKAVLKNADCFGDASDAAYDYLSGLTSLNQEAFRELTKMRSFED